MPNTNSNNNWWKNNNNTGVYERNGRLYTKAGGTEINVTNRFRPKSPPKNRPRTPSPPKKRPINPTQKNSFSSFFRGNTLTKSRLSAINKIINGTKTRLNKNEYNALKNYAQGTIFTNTQNPKYTIYYIDGGRRGINGFGVVNQLKKNKNNTMYRNIQLLMTRPVGGVGRFIVNRIKNNANKGGYKLKLQSVQSAVNFYKKMGFNVSTPPTHKYSKGNYVFMHYKKN